MRKTYFLLKGRDLSPGETRRQLRYWSLTKFFYILLILSIDGKKREWDKKTRERESYKEESKNKRENLRKNKEKDRVQH